MFLFGGPRVIAKPPHAGLMPSRDEVLSPIFQTRGYKKGDQDSVHALASLPRWQRVTSSPFVLQRRPGSYRNLRMRISCSAILKIVDFYPRQMEIVEARCSTPATYQCRNLSVSVQKHSSLVTNIGVWIIVREGDAMSFGLYSIGSSALGKSDPPVLF
jgi:hypothetical protein